MTPKAAVGGLIFLLVAFVSVFFFLDWKYQPQAFRAWLIRDQVQARVTSELGGLQLTGWRNFSSSTDGDALIVFGTVDGRSSEFASSPYPFSARVEVDGATHKPVITGVEINYHADPVAYADNSNAQATLFVVTIGIVSVVAFSLWVYALVDCLRSDFKTSGDKMTWFLALLFLSFLGMILYLIFAKRSKVLPVQPMTAT